MRNVMLKQGQTVRIIHTCTPTAPGTVVEMEHTHKGVVTTISASPPNREGPTGGACIIRTTKKGKLKIKKNQKIKVY